MVSNKHKKMRKKSRQERLSLILTPRSPQWRRNYQPELPYPRPKSTPLNMIRTEVFLQIKEKKLLKNPLLISDFDDETN